jgi:DNA-binding PadR family transcriptional regulator
MSPQPPTANDVILLKLLAERGRLNAEAVETQIRLFDTKMKMSSGPGRYFLEKARYHGWATKEVSGPKGKARTFYVITDKGREDVRRLADPPKVIESTNGHQTIPSP